MQIQPDRSLLARASAMGRGCGPVPSLRERTWPLFECALKVVGLLAETSDADGLKKEAL